jgi:hypothetical protein
MGDRDRDRDFEEWLEQPADQELIDAADEMDATGLPDDDRPAMDRLRDLLEE